MRLTVQFAGTTVGIGGTPRTGGALATSVQRITDVVKVAVGETLDAIVVEAKRLAPRDTGELEGSIHAEVYPDGLGGLVAADAAHATYVHYGTGVYAVGGQGRKTPWVYFNPRTHRFVWTRGNVAVPFLTTALEVERRRFAGRIVDHLNRLGVDAAVQSSTA